MIKTRYLLEVSMVLDPNFAGGASLMFLNEQFRLVRNEYKLIAHLDTAHFLSGCEATYMIFQDAHKTEVFLSLTSKTFFREETLDSDLLKLLSFLEDCYHHLRFNYCIGNIETTSHFTDQIRNSRTIPDEAIAKSEILVLPENQRFEQSVADTHFIYYGNNLILLLNKGHLLLEPSI